MQQAIISRQNTTVLYVSFEHGLREFALRSALSGGNINLNDLLGMIALPDANGVEARKVMAAGIEKFTNSLPENFFFSGAENCRAELDVDEVLELARMLPEGSDRLVILESLTLEMLGDNACDKLQALRQIAAAEKITFLVSMHYQTECGKRPHFIEGDDQMLLERFQKFTDSLLVCLTERLNLRRFVAMVKGQIDAQLVGKLEQKALQLSGGKRIKSDTYSLIRVIHNRYGRRELFLYLFQPDFVRMLEVASLPLTRA
jgi:hypothetical protein